MRRHLPHTHNCSYSAFSNPCLKRIPPLVLYAPMRRHVSHPLSPPPPTATVAVVVGLSLPAVMRSTCRVVHALYDAGLVTRQTLGVCSKKKFEIRSEEALSVLPFPLIPFLLLTGERYTYVLPFDIVDITFTMETVKISVISKSLVFVNISYAHCQQVHMCWPVLFRTCIHILGKKSIW